MLKCLVNKIHYKDKETTMGQSRKSMARQVQYTRQSKAWQQQQMKRVMAEAGYDKAPKAFDSKKSKKYIIAAGIAVVIIAVLLTIKFHWWGLFGGLLIAVAATGAFILFLRKKEEEMMRYYMAMGLPKSEFMKQMNRNGKVDVTKKQANKMSKTWDKVAAKNPQFQVAKGTKLSKNKKK